MTLNSILLKLPISLALATTLFAQNTWANDSLTEVCKKPPVANYDSVDCLNEGLARVMRATFKSPYTYDKYGYVDAAGQIVVPLQYDKAQSFQEGLAAVAMSRPLANVVMIDKWGFIDKTGKVIAPLQYVNVDSFSEGLAVVEKNGSSGFINKTGEQVIPLQYRVVCQKVC